MPVSAYGCGFGGPVGGSGGATPKKYASGWTSGAVAGSDFGSEFDGQYGYGAARGGPSHYSAGLSEMSPAPASPVYTASQPPTFGSVGCSDAASAAPSFEISAQAFTSRRSRRSATKPVVKEGRASAARVSRGSLYGNHEGISVTAPKRNPDEHVTVSLEWFCSVLLHYLHSLLISTRVNRGELTIHISPTHSHHLFFFVFCFPGHLCYLQHSGWWCSKGGRSLGCRRRHGRAVRRVQ